MTTHGVESGFFNVGGWKLVKLLPLLFHLLFVTEEKSICSHLGKTKNVKELESWIRNKNNTKHIERVDDKIGSFVEMTNRPELEMQSSCLSWWEKWRFCFCTGIDQRLNHGLEELKNWASWVIGSGSLVLGKWVRKHGFVKAGNSSSTDSVIEVCLSPLNHSIWCL